MNPGGSPGVTSLDVHSPHAPEEFGARGVSPMRNCEHADAQFVLFLEPIEPPPTPDRIRYCVLAIHNNLRRHHGCHELGEERSAVLSSTKPTALVGQLMTT